MSVNERLSDVCAAGRRCPCSLVAPVSGPVRRGSIDGSHAGFQSGAARAGFTLIEVLMAAFVLALGVLGLSAMFAGTARQQQLASQQTRSITVTQSADAMISENVGKLGVTGDCSNNLQNVDIYAGQPLYEGQWFVVPVKIETTNPAISFVSINPEERWSLDNWPYFRERPNTQLPRLLYRAVPDSANQIPVGKTGLSLSGQDETGQAPFSVGAPAFDGSFGIPRVLSDSVVVRVVTMGYGCKDNPPARYLLREMPQTLTFTLNPDTPCSEAPDYYSGDRDLHWLLGSDGESFMEFDQQRAVEDKDFANDPVTNASQLEQIWIRDVDASVGASLPDNDINCDGKFDYVESTQADADAILYQDGVSMLGPDRYDPLVPGVAGAGFYQIDPGDPTRANLRNVSDISNPAGQLFVSGAGFWTDSKPANPTGQMYVKKVNADWRFVSEIWLDSFEYRGHRLVSASDRVWYTQDPSRPGGRRADVAYSLLYRDLGPGAGAQYIVFTYALRPASSSAEYVPPEKKEDIQAGLSPVTLAEDVTLAYDDEIGKYYIEVAKLGKNEWVVQPGQIVIFTGDGSATPPIPGADAPVSVQFKREISGVVRGYLASAPRIGNRSLLEFAKPTTTFDVWAVQPAVKSRDGAKSVWGLRPIEARVFEVFDN